jgi:hypothetical protein
LDLSTTPGRDLRKSFPGSLGWKLQDAHCRLESKTGLELRKHESFGLLPSGYVKIAIKNGDLMVI